MATCPKVFAEAESPCRSRRPLFAGGGCARCHPLLLANENETEKGPRAGAFLRRFGDSCASSLVLFCRFGERTALWRVRPFFPLGEKRRRRSFGAAFLGPFFSCFNSLGGTPAPAVPYAEGRAPAGMATLLRATKPTRCQRESGDLARCVDHSDKHKHEKQKNNNR
nr:hypothetical protein [Pandoravirus massiliensis]